METFDYVFVVLVYRNPHDLRGFLASLARVEGSRKVIVVNSFYDQPTRDETAAVCEEHGCDFLNVENRGYGAGNNAGIRFARAHYRFAFLVISNPDIEIQALPATVLEQKGRTVLLGPLVRTENGKRQNPYMPAHSALRERLMCFYTRHSRSMAPFWAAVALNKTHRILFNVLFGRRERRVYALHGSFLLFSEPALQKLGLPFDERMFLFREEDHLARRARGLGIPMRYTPGIRVLHHEDGSVRFLSAQTRRYALDSLRIYFGLQ
ncbi:glycosyltransferase [Ethanoligenens harbinense]|uniref:Glycosyl transferase family 2 n=1 Tax=Ethanoligenens harbinense (strain DSM 18485 / JCM 12961 / CGMCC 1.5033 / YUAN-3) TaxID=663278 RepID=E6U8X2_ETHHY|nr:glycosyltransferase [Ethanoligenens harbinense]ADU26036.1 hypothetical protein Ethha_0451 [Ethanoligenens harbinense YUAN-3]AVQ95180.1 glycosyltransferase family 2 protein [Ethanoligenens harbinense YUAN-3]AYF37870.1 glycosyltransferase family 2 protein [Ethanoligenens harbinense]AYF40594.1 glycosyltransferase family 2 protein [Ethanoligenens harbinense]QCN91427.1 glycosyltransferase family 2 protein [Ethanoligenens harbinense]